MYPRLCISKALGRQEKPVSAQRERISTVVMEIIKPPGIAPNGQSVQGGAHNEIIKKSNQRSKPQDEKVLAEVPAPIRGGENAEKQLKLKSWVIPGNRKVFNMNMIVTPGAGISTDLIPVRNGVIVHDGKRAVLRPYSQEDDLTYCLPVDYDPKAQPKAFTRILKKACQYDRNDKDSKRKACHILEGMGYSLLSNCKLHPQGTPTFFLLIGSEASGKNELLYALSTLFGRKNKASVQPSQFVRQVQRERVKGKLVNIVTELSATSKLPDDYVKIMVRNKFRRTPNTTHWFAANEFPRIEDGGSNAFFRLATVIPLDHVFGDEERGKALERKLRAELPGILNMALWGLSRLKTRGSFNEPESCQEAKKAWRREADHVFRFIEDCCDLDSQPSCYKVASSELHLVYLIWAKRKKLTPRFTLSKCSLTWHLEMAYGIKVECIHREEMLYGIRLTPRYSVRPLSKMLY